MASAIFGPRGIAVAKILLREPSEGLVEIRGGIYELSVTIPLAWESNLFGIYTTNSIKTNNAMIFPCAANYPVGDIILIDSSRYKQLSLVLQKGTIQSDTFKFIRRIQITLDESA